MLETVHIDAEPRLDLKVCRRGGVDAIRDPSPARLSICMLTNLFPPVMSGSSIQCLGLARTLTDLGHKVIVLTAHISPDSAEQEVIDGVQVYRLPAFRLPKLPIAFNFPWVSLTTSPANLRRMRALLERHQVDVLHVHNHMFDMALNTVLLARKLKLPSVLTLHTNVIHPNPVFNAPLYIGDRFLLRHLVVRQMDQVICPDRNTEGYHRRRFGGRRTTIIPYGIHVDRPNPDDVADLRQRFGLSGKPVILSVGHVHAIRNRIDLVRAMPAVLQAVPNAVLLVVGEVIDRSALELAAKLGVSENLVFTGAQPHKLMPAFLELADIEVHWLNQAPNERTSLGIASMEAMFAGKPVISASVEEIYGSGVLRHGENVLMVEKDEPGPLAELIVDLLRDPARRARIGAAARATAQSNFSWEAVGSRHAQLYASLSAAAKNRTDAGGSAFGYARV